MSRIDDAIHDALSDQGRVVTEWVLFACTQSFDDEAASAQYLAAFRPGMLPHHVDGLVSEGIEVLESTLTSSDDDE